MSTRFLNFDAFGCRDRSSSSIDDLPAIPRKPKAVADRKLLRESVNTPTATATNCTAASSSSFPSSSVSSFPSSDFSSSVRSPASSAVSATQGSSSSSSFFLEKMSFHSSSWGSGNSSNDNNNSNHNSVSLPVSSKRTSRLMSITGGPSSSSSTKRSDATTVSVTDRSSSFDSFISSSTLSSSAGLTEKNAAKNLDPFNQLPDDFCSSLSPSLLSSSSWLAASESNPSHGNDSIVDQGTKLVEGISSCGNLLLSMKEDNRSSARGDNGSPIVPVTYKKQRLKKRHVLDSDEEDEMGSFPGMDSACLEELRSNTKMTQNSSNSCSVSSGGRNSNVDGDNSHDSSSKSSGSSYPNSSGGGEAGAVLHSLSTTSTVCLATNENDGRCVERKNDDFERNWEGGEGKASTKLRVQNFEKMNEESGGQRRGRPGGNGARLGKLKRPPCFEEEGRESMDDDNDSDESSGDEEDEKATAALVECLEVSHQMTERIVEALGGSDEGQRMEIRHGISDGRCCVCRSFSLPEGLKESGKGVHGTLKEYQKSGVQWLQTLHENDRNGILADEMGLGKTAQTCVFLNDLYTSGAVSSPSIVAAPASLLDNWINELSRWAPSLRCLKYHGKQSDRREMAVSEETEKKEEEERKKKGKRESLMSKQTGRQTGRKISGDAGRLKYEFLNSLLDKSEEKSYQLMVTSIQTLTSKWDEQYLRQIRPVAYLVVDEAHSLKNKDALTYRKLNRTVKCERRLLLTGSPIQNRMEELRNLLLFVMPHVFDADSLDLALKSYAEQGKRQRGFAAIASAKGGSANIITDDGSGRNNDSSHATSNDDSSKTVANSDDGSTITSCDDSSNSTASTNGNAPQGNSRTSLLDVLAKFNTTRKQKSLLPPEVECLQKVLAPFILRRLKSEVLGDLPRKVNEVVRCRMEGRQQELYMSEIRSKHTELVRQLKQFTETLTDHKTSAAAASALAISVSSPSSISKDITQKASAANSTSEVAGGVNQDRTTIAASGAASIYAKSTNSSASIPVDIGSSCVPRGVGESPESVSTAEASPTSAVEQHQQPKKRRKKRNAEVMEGTEEEVVLKGSSFSNAKFVNSLLFRLRRICNHPLMMQGYFTEEQMQKLIDYHHTRVSGFMGNPRKKVEVEIRKWSDYEIHQQVYGIPNLEWARIPHERLLDSAKIRYDGRMQSSAARVSLMDRRRMLQIVKEVTEKGEKALVFSQFTSYLDVIEETLQVHRPDINYVRLDGSTNVSERQGMVDQFSTDPNLSLFLLSTKAGGQGLNLTAATTVLLMDQDWNPHIDRQAEDRVHRLGQTKDVIIYRLCCRGTIEESILRCCQKKLNLDEAFGGNTELLQAALLQDSLEMHSNNGDFNSVVPSDENVAS